MAIKIEDNEFTFHDTETNNYMDITVHSEPEKYITITIHNNEEGFHIQSKKELDIIYNKLKKYLN